MNTKTLTLLTWFSLNFLVVGCGNLGHSNAIVAPPESYQFQSDSTTGATDSSYEFISSNFICNGVSTITPKLELFTNGTGHFEVCRNKNTNNQTDVAVHGKTINSGSICVFPAEMNGTGNSNYIVDSKGSPISQCQQATTDITGQPAAYFAFKGSLGNNTGFNAAYVVELPQRALMKYCLVMNFSDANKCSDQTLSYSFGSF